jgi:phage host-nuclease inhibitor protein Gam
MDIKSFDDLGLSLSKLAQVESSIYKLENDMNKLIDSVKAKYAEKSEQLRTEQVSLRTDIEVFCRQNKEEFEKQRSREFPHGTVAFRNNPPKVAQLSRKFSVATSLELVKKIMKKYIRTRDEINKEMILADYAGKIIDDKKLASVGLRIDSEESFSIDVKREELN